MEAQREWEGGTGTSTSNATTCMKWPTIRRLSGSGLPRTQATSTSNWISRTTRSTDQSPFESGFLQSRSNAVVSLFGELLIAGKQGWMRAPILVQRWPSKKTGTGGWHLDPAAPPPHLSHLATIWTPGSQPASTGLPSTDGTRFHPLQVDNMVSHTETPPLFQTPLPVRTPRTPSQHRKYHWSVSWATSLRHSPAPALRPLPMANLSRDPALKRILQQRLPRPRNAGKGRPSLLLKESHQSHEVLHVKAAQAPPHLDLLLDRLLRPKRSKKIPRNRPKNVSRKKWWNWNGTDWKHHW